jgi:hypothetical protein
VNWLATKLPGDVGMELFAMVGMMNVRFARGLLAAGLTAAVVAVCANNAKRELSAPRQTAIIDIPGLTAATDTTSLPVPAIENPI